MSADRQALLEAFAAGVAEERARIQGIMALPLAQGREGAALAMALRGLPSGFVIQVLRMAPAAPSPTYNVRPLLPRHLRLAYHRPN